MGFNGKDKTGNYLDPKQVSICAYRMIGISLMANGNKE
jgi:hypothetical protein